MLTLPVNEHFAGGPGGAVWKRLIRLRSRLEKPSQAKEESGFPGKRSKRKPCGDHAVMRREEWKQSSMIPGGCTWRAGERVGDTARCTSPHAFRRPCRALRVGSVPSPSVVHLLGPSPIHLSGFGRSQDGRWAWTAILMPVNADEMGTWPS